MALCSIAYSAFSCHMCTGHWHTDYNLQSHSEHMRMQHKQSQFYIFHSIWTMYFLLTGLCGFSNHTYNLSYSGSTHRKIQARGILKCHFVFQVMSEGKNSMCINQVFCTSIYFIFSVTCANPGISAVGLVTWAVPIISTLYDLMFMN